MSPQKIAAVMLCAFLASACVSETAYGPCVGLNGGEDSTLVYHGSTRNIVLAVVFAETIIPPVVVALKEYKCPVARKARPVTNNSVSK